MNWLITPCTAKNIPARFLPVFQHPRRQYGAERIRDGEECPDGETANAAGNNAMISGETGC